MNPIRLAISTCPNDTFAFHGILHRKVELHGLQYDIRLLDISQLNAGVAAGAFDVAKASFYAALKLADRYWVLSSGAALGYGNGPLLLSRQNRDRPDSTSQITLCPGEDTTATLLFGLFYGKTRLQQVVFSQIIPLLQQGVADFGVCIHEGRFTFHESGLHLVEDLGDRWQTETGLPLPLGGILADRELPHEIIRLIQDTIRQSIVYAQQHRAEALETMRHHAQALDDQVLFQHVDLYVNHWTIDLGDLGCQALKALSQMATTRMAIPVKRDLEIFA